MLWKYKCNNIFCLSDPGDRIGIGFKGITLEICAGLIDKKDKSAHEIAIEEVEEECGYKVQPDQMEFVHKFFDLGCTRSLFYTGKIILTLNFWIAFMLLINVMN